MNNLYRGDFMNEKVKKLLMEYGYKTLVAAVILLAVFALRFFFPDTAEKISIIWTKNTDLKKTGALLVKTFKEISPF